MGNRGWLIFLAAFLCSNVLGLFKRDILIKDFTEGLWGGLLIALASFSLLPEDITSRIYLCAACMIAGAVLMNFLQYRHAPETVSWLAALAGIALDRHTGGISTAVAGGILLHMGCSAVLPEQKNCMQDRVTRLGGLLGFLLGVFSLM